MQVVEKGPPPSVVNWRDSGCTGWVHCWDADGTEPESKKLHICRYDPCSGRKDNEKKHKGLCIVSDHGSWVQFDLKDFVDQGPYSPVAFVDEKKHHP